jgi:hypothetical protein
MKLLVGRDEECGGDNRGGDHDRLDGDLQEKDVCVGTQEGEDGEQRYGVQEDCVREPAGRGQRGRVWWVFGRGEHGATMRQREMAVHQTVVQT